MIMNASRPFQELLRRHVVEDLFWIKLGTYRRGDPEFYELKNARDSSIAMPWHPQGLGNYSVPRELFRPVRVDASPNR
jgi:hypothetical protein